MAFNAGKMGKRSQKAKKTERHRRTCSDVLFDMIDRVKKRTSFPQLFSSKTIPDTSRHNKERETVHFLNDFFYVKFSLVKKKPVAFLLKKFLHLHLAIFLKFT
jgi:hypothetical protein